MGFISSRIHLTEVELYQCDHQVYEYGEIHLFKIKNALSSC